MFIIATNVGETVPTLYEVDKIIEIAEAPNDERIIVFKGTSNSYSVKVSDTLTSIMAQQNTTGKDLGLVLVTDAVTTKQLAINSKTIRTITDNPNGAGAKIHFTHINTPLITTEDLAAIYSQQGASGPVNLSFVLVTVKEIGNLMIVTDHQIAKIFAIDPAVEATGSTIKFHSARGDLNVTETVTALFTATPQ